MLLTRLHARRWHGPDLLLEIDLVPPCADHLAGSRRGQDQEFKCPRRDALLLTQLRHQGRDIAIMQRGMVLDLANLVTGRQQLIEMAAPARGVLALAVTTHRCPVDDRLDTAAQPARSLGLRVPDRFQHLHDEPDIDRLHGQGTELDAIAAVVIGGTLLTGGYGSAIGATIGAAIIGMAQIGIIFANWDSNWYYTFLGVILFLAVGVNTLIRRRAMRARR